jgi:DNA-binding transcriptional ArsR family regulator
MVVTLGEQDQVDLLFHALADATGRDMVRRSLDVERSVSALAGLYPMSFAAVQKQVAVPERARLVTKRRDGRRQLVRGNIDAIRGAVSFLGQFEEMWRSRIERFGEILADDLEEGAIR